MKKNCKKCGSEDIYTEYRKKGYVFSKFELPDECDEIDNHNVLMNESLYRKCNICGYSWLEKTMDGND